MRRKRVAASDEGLLVIWPPEYQHWARQQGLIVARREGSGAVARAVAASPAEPARPGRPRLEIVNPPAGATYSIDPTLRREFQTIPLRVVASRPGPIEWRINGRLAGRAPSDDPWLWPLEPGQHTIRARDARGRTVEVSITVR